MYPSICVHVRALERIALRARTAKSSYAFEPPCQRRCAGASLALRSERTCCLRCGLTRGALRRGDEGKVGREEGGRFRTRGQEVGKKGDARTGSTQRRIHALVARRLSTTSSCRSYGLHELTCKPVRVRPSLSLFFSLSSFLGYDFSRC